MSDYYYAPDETGQCCLCGCPGASHSADGMCPDAGLIYDPDGLRGY